MKEAVLTLTKPQKNTLFSGILFTAIIAGISYIGAKLPVIGYAGPLALSILIAVFFRNSIGYPEQWRFGISFTGKIILRVAIVLYGIRLNFAVIASEGLPLLLQAAGSVLFATVAMVLAGRWLRIELKLALLLGAGTGICGAAAIAAAAPIIRAKEEDTALSVGMIAFLGTIFALLYPAVSPIIDLTSEEYGYWTGFTLHEIAHAALAGAAGGNAALDAALISKLSRVLLLFPFCLILLLLTKKKNSTKSPVQFPYFLIGFLLVSLIGTLGTEKGVLSEHETNAIASAGTFLMGMAMSALGMSVDLQKIKKRAAKPLAALLIVSLLLSTLTLFFI
ncbi:YeiH family protein [Domibacillus epiphyticus]|uniref:Sulfate exporter family transporter n=1 Tax=Domibacillus epiphyticus TaxID=1714355 RepID=A0A1V2AAV1_9BACI|nr:putative sulfate exporter family transporter [Domibacillus epiphyticus]OMP68125.1 hypothetical protein BTO28_04015 [Domibacillus epiphyticus]